MIGQQATRALSPPTHQSVAAGWNWTDARIDLLKKRWSDGLSASQIAGELGGVTRNAVIGKVHRLGLSGRVKTSRIARPRTSRATADRPSRHPPQAAQQPSEPAADIAIPFAQRKTILQLTPDTCRWPVGDPRSADFFYCGGDREGDHTPYCAFHRRMATQ